MPDSNHFYTLTEAAHLLRVSKTTIYRLIAEQKIAATKIRTTSRISQSAIDDFINQNTTPKAA